MPKPTCAASDCGDEAKIKGYCRKHHWRWKKYGDPAKLSRIFGDDEARFWSKVDKNGPIPERRPELGPCWIWKPSPSPTKYGYFALRRNSKRLNVLAHRWGYETFVGPIPEGLHIDHLCRTPACVRGTHLEPVTPGENTKRGDAPVMKLWRAGICGKGHSMDDAYQLASGARACRTCSLEKQRAERQDPASHRHRLMKKPDAKFRHLTPEQRETIRELAATGEYSQTAIARRVGCSQPTVSAVVKASREATR